jgi:hypothetical protein
MTPALARMRHAQLKPEELVHAIGRPFTAKHSKLHDAIRKTMSDAAEILSVPTPDLLLGNPSAPLPFSSALSPYGSVLVHVPALEANPDSLVYLAGVTLAEQRAELTARAFFPTVSELTTLLAAAVRVGRHEKTTDERARALDASLASVITTEERDGLRSILRQMTSDGGLVDVKRWLRAADASSMRAGLLLARDVGPARRAIMAEPTSAADLSPKERVGALYKFATSDGYADLRGAIGVSVREGEGEGEKAVSADAQSTQVGRIRRREKLTPE